MPWPLALGLLLLVALGLFAIAVANGMAWPLLGATVIVWIIMWWSRAGVE